MEIEEVKQKINESSNKDWFNDIEINLIYTMVGLNQKANGFIDLYEFFQKQKNFWDSTDDNSIGNLKESKQHFIKIHRELEDTLVRLANSQLNIINQKWSAITAEIRNVSEKAFPFGYPETEFLLQVYKNYPLSGYSALLFLRNEQINLQKPDSIIGVNLAYEFKLKNSTSISSRIESEQKSIQELRNEFEEYMKTADKRFNNQMDQANNTSKEYASNIDKIKNEKAGEFDGWFAGISDKYKDDQVSLEKTIIDLIATYEAQLKLAKPAEYWSKRATQMKKEAWNAVRWMIALIILAGCSLYYLLWQTPEGMLLSFTKGDTSAIKWSIIYITFISFLAFGIRAVYKVAFSSFHLARDAEEREQLTYFYLALLKDANVDEKDRQLIMQSLFSRADTGLLKDDHGPTMPGNFTNKLMN